MKSRAEVKRSSQKLPSQPSKNARSKKPRRYFKGRPVHTEEDRKHMKPDLPPETEWVKELLGE